MFNPNNHYWIVGEDETRVYSSDSGTYVPLSDENYQSWCATGNVATRISANDMVLWRIKHLEASVTERMMQEAVSQSLSTFGSGPYQGKTSAEVIAIIRGQIDALREQIS